MFICKFTILLKANLTPNTYKTSEMSVSQDYKKKCVETMETAIFTLLSFGAKSSLY